MESASELSHQFGVSVAVVHVIQWIKHSNLPLLNKLTPDSTAAIKVIALIAAILTSAGFKILNGDVTNGWNVFIPPIAVIIDATIHTVAQYGAQKGYYAIAVKTDGILQTIIKAMQALPQQPPKA
jgi:hypothetical protein